MLVWPQNKTQQQKVALSWMWLRMLIDEDVQEAEAVGSLELGTGLGKILKPSYLKKKYHK